MVQVLLRWKMKLFVKLLPNKIPKFLMIIKLLIPQGQGIALQVLFVLDLMKFSQIFKNILKTNIFSALILLIALLF
jgi:hypothetical protein